MISNFAFEYSLNPFQPVYDTDCDLSDSFHFPVPPKFQHSMNWLALFAVLVGAQVLRIEQATAL